MSRRLLVLGGTGLLGTQVVAHGESTGWHVTAAARQGADVDIDVRDLAALTRLLEAERPDLVVNCAAMVDLSACERDPGLAYEVNARPVAALASWAAAGRRLVHISTDHFFGGEGDQAHAEGHPVELVNEYARTKFAAEAFALTSPAALVIRTSIVGIRGWERDSFAEWAIRAVESGAPVELFADAFTSSIDTGRLAAAMFELVELGARGLLNVGARQVYSKAEFVREIARQLGRRLEEVPVTVPQQPVRRGTALGLDVGKASSLLSAPLPALPDVVAAVLEHHQQRT